MEDEIEHALEHKLEYLLPVLDCPIYAIDYFLHAMEHTIDYGRTQIMHYFTMPRMEYTEAFYVCAVRLALSFVVVVFANAFMWLVWTDCGLIPKSGARTTTVTTLPEGDDLRSDVLKNVWHVRSRLNSVSRSRRQSSAPSSLGTHESQIPMDN
ncbi:hypothetical protein CC86DRAFT_37535 [Ophiobolus disseminans]|uniref:Uncharacterized protein n=1 Tax=Ophiobolus disseminans TaxID=1469910 RepID=A0A6A6ZYS1_9PLEO|nr:hypothetical protein CC86DRAFT_37535 [Ophiobolus disseminans]